MIYITGDTHGEYDTFLNRIYRHPVTKDDTVIVCGDFGFVWDAFPYRRVGERVQVLFEEVVTL